MRKTLLFVLMLVAMAATAQQSALWMREPVISPDGQTIVFRFKGDLFKVPVNGGQATQLTSNAAYDHSPIWSHDSKTIAFSSNRNDNFDIYIIDVNGGSPRRITTNSASENPVAFSNDDKTIYFKARYMKDAAYSQFPTAGFNELYSVSIDGGRPMQLSSVAMNDVSLSNDGITMLYDDVKGYEDTWRKHHTSSVAHDIWSYNLNTHQFESITNFKYETRNPVFAPADNNFMYYLCEKDGTSNIYKRNLVQADKNVNNDAQLTNFKGNPVRFLSVAKNGTFCYAYDGELYTGTDAAPVKKLNVIINTDDIEADYQVEFKSGGISSVAVAPSGKEIAFIIRGDVYVTSADYANTRRITNTPEQERGLTWNPDGRSLAYASERKGTWNIYQTEIVGEDEKMMLYANALKETPITEDTVACFQPAFSPDGKEIAYLENRTTLRVKNLKSKKVRTILDGKYNYSYVDGDQWYQWSPDANWFAVNYMENGGWNREDVGLVKADGSGEIHNLTQSGYSNSCGGWVLDGKALIVYSDQYGLRSHGSWGAQNDIFLMFLDQEAFDKFCMNKEEFALAKEEAENSKDKKKEEKEEKKKEKKEEAGKVVLPQALELDIENAKNRMVRLTITSGSHSDCFLDNEGTKLYYFVSFEKGYDLWMRDFKEGSTKMIAKLGTGYAGFDSDKKHEKVFMVSRGQIQKLDLNSGNTTPIAINAEFNYRPSQEREYIFDHAWQQVTDKFYDPDIHGIDWEAYKHSYQRFLPYINNNFDFAEMLSELLGELNASHTGARYYYSGDGDATAVFGMFFDEKYEGDGLKIKEILKKNPMVKASSKIKPGVVIEKIDGQLIEAGKDYYPYLNHKAGKTVVLTLKDGHKQWDERVKMLSKSQQSDLLYLRWVEQREALVDSLSNGRVGYVHVQGMDSPSFRTVYSKVFGKNRNKEAIVVDTRFNGGGWLHDDLATMFGGKAYVEFCPRGQFVGREPLNKWAKPSVVVMNESNYSDAHGFPYTYKTLEIGKLVGMPVPGTMTAVWWENQIDPSIVFGIPEMGVKDMQGHYLENQELQPDIMVNNDPNSMTAGRDLQIEAAVGELLKQIDAQKK